MHTHLHHKGSGRQWAKPMVDNFGAVIVLSLRPPNPYGTQIVLALRCIEVKAFWFPRSHSRPLFSPSTPPALTLKSHGSALNGACLPRKSLVDPSGEHGVTMHDDNHPAVSMLLYMSNALTG